MQSYHIDPYCPTTINALLLTSQTCGRFVIRFEKRKTHDRYLKLCSRFRVVFVAVLWYFFLEVAPSVTICYGQTDRRRNLCPD